MVATMTKEQREALIAAGLCTTCRKPAAPGRTMCRRHLDMKAAQAAAKRNRRRAQGKCVFCGDQATSGHSKCSWCMAKHNEGNRQRAGDRRSRGDCPKCGRRPQAGQVYCQRCITLKAAYKKRLLKRAEGERLRAVRVAEFRRVWSHNPAAVAYRMEALMKNMGRGSGATG